MHQHSPPAPKPPPPQISPGEGAPAAAGSRLSVFTTRPDTLYGATYMVVAPEHPLLDALLSGAQRAEARAYADAAARKSDLERTELQKEKTGVFTGAAMS
jgi:leucyl-tRNA synthetase